MALPANVKIVKDMVPKVLEAMRTLAASQVLVGIPAANAARHQDGQPINNAALGYIHEHGAPEHNLPARPFLIPGIADAQPAIEIYLERAAKAVIAGRGDWLDQALHAAGMAGRNAVIRKITEGPFAPLSRRTLEARARRRKSWSAKRRRAWILAGGQKPLIDTGQLRASITYVIRKRGST